MVSELDQILDRKVEETYSNRYKFAIYSKTAILCFSFLFCSFVSGILLRKNLSDIGKKNESNFALLLSFLVTTISVFVLIYFEINSNWVFPILNLLGSYIITNYCFSNYFSNIEEYSFKSVWKPIIIVLIAYIIIFTIAFLIIDWYSSFQFEKKLFR